MEDDDELDKIRKAYRSGEMLTGELKAKCISELQAYVKGFQERCSKVTEEVIDEFMKYARLNGKPTRILRGLK
jgi:tryptophanyl-tRNA synthetase